jgi:DnaJ-class molecular chaperone
VNLTLDVKFMDAVKGSMKEITYARKIVCGNCKGSKLKPGTSPVSCN